MHKRPPYCCYDSLDRCGRIYFAIWHACTLSRTHTWGQPTLVLMKNKYRWKCGSTHRIKAPGCAPTHTNSTERVMRNSSSSLAAPVSALCKQRPVVDAPDIWVLFFLCVRVRVRAWIAAGTPLG